MTETNSEDIGIVIFMFVGAIAMAYGLNHLTEGYTTMQQIEALGALGQVTAAENYSIATEKFTNGVYATFGGFMLLLWCFASSVVNEMKKKLDELS